MKPEARDIDSHEENTEVVSAGARSSSPEGSDTSPAPHDIHPAAAIFPMMIAEEHTELVASIKEHKLQHPIVTYEGLVLDGRNRLAACAEAGVIPVFVDYPGDDPEGYVLRANLHRRHLTISQRAIIAADMADMKSGSRTDLGPGANLHEVSVGEAAEKLNVSKRSVEAAKAIKASGNTELINEVRSGDTTLNAATQEISMKSGPGKTEAQIDCDKIHKLWDKTSSAGHDLFLEIIDASYND
jgi:hypothetical protein